MPPPADRAAPLRVGGDVKAPGGHQPRRADYPEVARKARISGIVIVECIIDKNGNVRDVQGPQAAAVRPRPGRRGRGPEVEIQARHAERQPVDVIFNLTVNFKLN